ncbi:MAG: hypothetical protein H8D43_00565 [Chloroflexi bacterium]|nr:hypothetical protein [Chloroflexota bacterium]
MLKVRSVDWKLVLLKQNPFPEVPPRTPAEAVWAGMSRLKDQFNTLFVEALSTSATQVVLNRGDWGSGKTHAAIYFGTRDRLPRVKGEQVRDVCILYVRTPKDPSQADTILYRNILEVIHFGRLRQTIRDIIAEYGVQNALGKLQDVVESEALGKALWLLGLEKSGTGQLRLFGDDEGPNEWQRLLEAYFFSQHTKTDLKRLELSRGIDNSQDRFRILGGVLQCLTGLAPVEEIEHRSRVLLWIDEMEDLIYFTSRQYRPFTQGLRDLIDRLPGYFTLFMNFTLAEPEVLGDIGLILGGALMDRITHQIYFQQPNEEEAYQYAIELLDAFRTQAPQDLGLPPTYPFSEESLKEIIRMLSKRTPREINKRCSEIITNALMKGAISAAGKGIISMDFVAELDKDRLDLEFRC